MNIVGWLGTMPTMSLDVWGTVIAVVLYIYAGVELVVESKNNDLQQWTDNRLNFVTAIIGFIIVIPYFYIKVRLFNKILKL
jgi:heme/copper-type cytochrome/quinol oxidase subunit 2